MFTGKGGVAMGRIRWKEKLLITAALIIGITLMFIFQVGCPFQRLTGIDCPGCGMTRAVLLVLQGRFSDALRQHWMVWSLPALYLVFLTDGRIFRRKWMNHALITLLAAGFLLHWGWKIIV